MKYYAAKEEEEKVDELEAEGQVDEPVDDDEEEEDTRSDGEVLYQFLKSKKLVDDGNFADLTSTLRKMWDAVADDPLAISDIREELIAQTN